MAPPSDHRPTKAGVRPLTRLSPSTPVPSPGAQTSQESTPCRAPAAPATLAEEENVVHTHYPPTDGGPGCNTQLGPRECVCNARASNCCLFDASHNCLDDDATTGLIADLAESGIRTMVLGITQGQELDGDACAASDRCGANFRCVYGTQECIAGRCSNQLNRVLDDMAVAGRTAVDGHHFEVADLAQLERQLAAAAGSVAPCAYELDALADHADRLVVTIDDQPIQRDPDQRNGWEVREGVIEFHGAACQLLRDGRPHEINARCE